MRRPAGAHRPPRLGVIAVALAGWMVLVALLGSVHLADGSHITSNDGGLSHRAVLDPGQPAHVGCVDHHGEDTFDLAGTRPIAGDHCWLTDQAPARSVAQPPVAVAPLAMITAPPVAALAELRFAQRVLAHAPKTSPPA